MFKNLLAVIMVLALPGCGTFVPVIDMSTVPKDKLQQSYRIKVYEISSASTYPEVIEYIGSISAFSCKHMLYDPRHPVVTLWRSFALLLLMLGLMR